MFLDGMTNTCDIEHSLMGESSEPHLSVETGVRCRIEYSNKIIRNSPILGEIIVSYARIFFAGSVDLTETDRVKFDGRWHAIQKIERHQLRRNVHHLEIYCT